MLNMRVCAACLATDVRMYSMSAASLLEPYRLLTGIESEGMPQKLCWECAALVHKFNMFRRKCERASLLLQDIYNRHDEVSEQDVLRIDREQHNLISYYSICSIEVYDSKSNLKTEFKNDHQERTSHDTQTGDAPVESSVKAEINIVKKEDDTTEMKLEVDDMELIDDVFVEEDCPPVKLPPKIKRVIKRRQGFRPKQKTERKTAKVFAKDFGMKEEILTQEQQTELMRERQNDVRRTSARFLCTLCYSPFSMQKTYNNHMLKHDPVSGEFVCDICKLRHKTRYQLYKHISTLHMKRYSCQLCPSVFYERFTAQKHYAWHKGVVYVCHICGASFNKKTTYQNHLRIKHPSEHVCELCGAPFHSKKGLLLHINLSHKHDTAASGGDHETRGPYCADCDIQFTCKQAWTRHVLISPKHQHERHICALGCETCGETLPDEESLRAHRAVHRRPINSIMLHARYDFVTPIICEQCGVIKKNKQAYRVHIHSAHTDKTHTTQHRRHDPTKRAPCMCKLCGKGFQGEGYMRRHDCRRERRTNKCDVCSKVFMKSQALRDHYIRTHTMDLRFKCKICGQAFADRSNMYRHKLVHSDVKPYTCDICSKCFKSHDTVKSHIEFVHLKKPWPKRDRNAKPNSNKRRSRDVKRTLLEHT